MQFTQVHGVAERARGIRERLLAASGLKRLADRAPRAELEQAVLRVAIAAIVLVYLLVYTLWDGVIDDHELEVDLVAL
ncbi:MAG TPA: hypothetical protein VFC24_15740, partial [Casimicrobiaceae bacterium]|nr:hypothetical protein [Casimicrobiaceae bacterium]